VHHDAAIERFYTTRAWKKCRAAFLQDRGGLCEKCLARGIIEAGSKDRPLEVHHKIPLTAENVNDPKVALNWDNLQLLCKDCHDEEKDRVQKRWRVDEAGRVTL